MNSTNKKAPQARGMPGPLCRQAKPTVQFKPVAALSKTGVSAQSRKQPVAPPVYRPEAKKMVQLKAAPQRKSPITPYRPEQKRVAQPKMPTTTPAPPKVPRVYSPQPKQVNVQHKHVQLKSNAVAPQSNRVGMSMMPARYLPQPKVTHAGPHSGKGRMTPVPFSPGRQTAIQPMLSSVFSAMKETWYGLTELEMACVQQGKLVKLTGLLPIKGSFSCHNLTGDLHVEVADPNQNVSKKLVIALKKLKALMEYAAEVHHLNVNLGKIELRPTGGVVVKQLIELLAFVDRDSFERLALKEKLEKFKVLRNRRLDEANQKIRAIKQHRDSRLQAEGLDLVRKARKQLPDNYKPSRGMKKLLARAEGIRGEYKGQIDQLRSITGKRTGEYMGEVFFDEHFYLLQSLIGRGGNNDFSVSAFGLANQLPQDSAHDLQIVQQVQSNENAILLRNEAGDKARAIYAKKLHQKLASLRINIYYGKISEIISFIG